VVVARRRAAGDRAQRGAQRLAPSAQGCGHPTPRQARGAAVGSDAEGAEAAVAAPMPTR